MSGALRKVASILFLKVFLPSNANAAYDDRMWRRNEWISVKPYASENIIRIVSFFFSERLNFVLFGNLNEILSKFVPIGTNAPWETVLRKERQFYGDSFFSPTWPARQFLCFSIGNHWIMTKEHSHTSWVSEIFL